MKPSPRRGLLWSLNPLKITKKKVKNVVSKYFGKGFDFCRRQLAHYHPNLGIDLNGMGMDCDMLKKEEAGEAKEGYKEEEE